VEDIAAAAGAAAVSTAASLASAARTLVRGGSESEGLGRGEAVVAGEGEADLADLASVEEAGRAISRLTARVLGAQAFDFLARRGGLRPFRRGGLTPTRRCLQVHAAEEEAAAKEVERAKEAGVSAQVRRD